MNFSEHNVFVAGGTSGINLGIADAFARAGARVAVFSRSPDKVEAAKQSLAAHGGEVLGFSGDVRAYDRVEAVIEETVQTWGTLDVLVSGAAGNFLAPAASLSANAFKSVIDIDLLGTFNVLRAGFERLNKPGASVINISAPQAWLPTPFQVHACAAKAGVDQVTRTCAYEWGPSGVRVNAIAPGPIADTEGMNRLAPGEGMTRKILSSVPCKRLGKVEDIAEAALWLSSKQASFINGAILPVDGGWSLGGSGNMMAGMQP